MSFFKEEYFQIYIRNATNSPSGNVSTIAQIPQDVPLETLIALTTYKPQVAQGIRAIQQPQTIATISAASALRLQQTGLFTNNLQNFRPSVSGRAIQRRRGDGQRIPLNPRERILRGLDPRTRQLVQDLEDLRILRQLQDRLQQQTDRLEQQINKYTSIFNALVNAPDALVSAGLTFLINKIDQLEQLYNAAKAVYELVKRAYQNTRKAIIKALFKDIPRFRDRVRKSLNVLRRILKLREIPRILRFPKFPKRPRINFTIGDFYAKYKLALGNLRIKNSLAYDRAYATALQQSGFEIVDPNKDKIQRGLAKARNSLRQVRAEFQVKQAIRTAAVENVRAKLIDNVRHVNRTVERERQNILKQYQNAKTAGELARQQVGSRKAYLSTTEASQLLQSSRVDASIKNIYGDLPTGTITPDGRTVYTDRTNNRVYVLQTARDRINELANRTTARATANLGEIASAANTINNLTTSYGALVGGLNNNVIKTEVLRNIAQEAQTVNQITQQAQQTPPEISSLSTGTQQQEIAVNEQTKTITTVSRRLRPNDALNEAELLNRQRAQQVGYSVALTTEGTQPIPKRINGQTVFEARLTITYASQSLEGRITQVGVGQGRGSTVIARGDFGQPIILPQLTPSQLQVSPIVETQVAETTFIRASATATPPRTTAPRTRVTGSNVPPIATPGFDIDESQSIFGTPRKLSVFEIEALTRRLENPDISDQEKARIRQLLGIAQQIPSDLELPKDPQLEFSQEATRPNLSVTTAGNRARLTFNAGRVSNIEYSIDNGRTWTILNPPSRAGDVVIDNLDNGVYAARVRGIRADGTRTSPSQPQAVIIRASQPIIRRTEPFSSTSYNIIFDDVVTPNDIKNYQFTTRGDNTGWTDALPAAGRGAAVSSPISIFGLEVDRTYTVRIRALYRDGTVGNVSNQATITTFKTRSEGGGFIA